MELLNHPACAFYVMFIVILVHILLLHLMVNTVRNFSATTFNCHGIKSSLKYVLDQARNHDIVFVNEHWLQASDIHHITNICTENAKWCYFKTSVDPNHELTAA